MNKIKHRTLVRIALNAKGKRVSCLVSTGGMLIPFDEWNETDSIDALKNRNHDFWLQFSFDNSLREWKERVKQNYNAVRFQRVMLVGGDE